MFVSPEAISCRNRGHGNRAKLTLKPSSSQKLLAVRACNRAIAARTVTKTSNIGCKPNLDDGFAIAKCALEEPAESEFNEVVVAII